MNNMKSVFMTLAALALIAGSSTLTGEFSLADAAGQGASWEKFQDCRNDCNEQFGSVDILPPSTSRTSYLAYANCVAACERKYWRGFDKEMDSDK